MPQVPPNGLVVYTGTILTDEGKEKKVNIDFEPFKPINTSLYLCDNKFHTEALNELLESDNKYGFCILCSTFTTACNLQYYGPKCQGHNSAMFKPLRFCVCSIACCAHISLSLAVLTNSALLQVWLHCHGR